LPLCARSVNARVPMARNAVITLFMCDSYFP
jgi:hypothetical protein